MQQFVKLFFRGILSNSRHASLQSTQIYTHLTFSDMKKAYDNAHPRATKSKKESEN